ncbi:MAG TPA: FliH/SctL family protein [Polyangiaceae bacterium]|jgi:flagellar assembly protein FliH|nr:FliH/SctL family protein [Polyangiaceae bacterium]
MSKSNHDALAVSVWTPEVTVITRRPSWMARKMSTRPPAPAAPTPIPSAPSAHPPPEATASAPSAAPAALPASEIISIAPVVDIMASTVIAQLSDDNAALRAQVAEMAAAMARLRRQILEASEGELVQLAVVIAERVVARELATEPDLVVHWARQAIDALAAKDEVVIAVAKDVASDVSPEAWAKLGVPHEVLQDAQLAPGVIEVRTPQGIVPVNAEARLQAVATALGATSS